MKRCNGYPAWGVGFNPASKASVRGRLHLAWPVEGATIAPIIIKE